MTDTALAPLAFQFLASQIYFHNNIPSNKLLDLGNAIFFLLVLPFALLNDFWYRICSCAVCCQEFSGTVSPSNVRKVVFFTPPLAYVAELSSRLWDLLLEWRNWFADT